MLEDIPNIVFNVTQAPETCQWPSTVNWLCGKDDDVHTSSVVTCPAESCWSEVCLDEPCILLSIIYLPIITAIIISLGIATFIANSHILPSNITHYYYKIQGSSFVTFAAAFLLFLISASKESPRCLTLAFAGFSLCLILNIVYFRKTKLQLGKVLQAVAEIWILVLQISLISIEALILTRYPTFYRNQFIISIIIKIFFVTVSTVNTASGILISARSGSFARVAPQRRIDDSQDLGHGEENAGWISFVTIQWIIPLMEKGWRGNLNNVQDCFHMPKDIEIKHEADVLEFYYKRELSECCESKDEEEEPEDDELLNPSSEHHSNHDLEKLVVIEPVVRREEKHFSIMRILFQLYGWRLVPMFLIKFCAEACNLSNPILLNLFISFLSMEDKDIWYGVRIGLGMIALTLTGTVLDQMYFYNSWKDTFRIRGALMITIYRKMLQVNQVQLARFTTGEIVNFMSRDAWNISFFPIYVQQALMVPIDVVAVLILLYMQVGISFLAGLGLCILCLPFNQWLSGRILKYDQAYYKCKDERVKVVTEMLNGIRTVKLAALEKFFGLKIGKIRLSELKNIRNLKYLDAFCVYIWAALPVLLSLTIFATYTSLGNQLTAAMVFTVLCYVNLLIGPLNSFPWLLNALIEAYVSSKRLNKYYMMKQFDKSVFYSCESSANTSRISVESSPAPSQHTNVSDMSELPAQVISMNNCRFSYGKRVNPEEQKARSAFAETCLKVLCMSHETDKVETEDNNKGFQQLHNLNISIEHGNFIGIFGKVGAGKTSFLSAIIGDMNKLDGSIYTSEVNKGFGYVPQEPWLQTGTIRDNILMGSKFDKSHYENVIRSCALNDDLKSLPHNDLTQVGERGITLSGGQKARVTLARALYKNFSVYLLDDPLSAVDAHVAAHIYKHCIRGALKSKTVILCTHHTHYLSEADFVVSLKNGHIDAMGLPVDVLNNVEDLSDKESARKRADSESAEIQELPNPELMAQMSVDEEEQRVGEVDSALYIVYFKAAGVFLCALTFISLALMQASKNISDWWLSYWTDHIDSSIKEDSFQLYPNMSLNDSGSLQFYHINFIDMTHTHSESYQHLSLPHLMSEDDAKKNPNDLQFYLLVYGLIAAANSVFSLARAFTFAVANIRASVKLHEKLLDSVMKFKNSIFSTTPVGRIVNRFSSDVGVLDDDLPFIFNIVLAQGFTAIGLLVVISTAVPYIIPFVLMMLIVFYRLQVFYRRSSRELRRIATVTMSPVYNHFNESLYGAGVIKAMRVSRLFMDENEKRMEDANRARFNERAVQRWFAMRLQLVSSSILMLAIIFGLTEKQFLPNAINSAMLGLCLSYCLTIRSTLTQLLATFAENEKNIISVERIEDYANEEKFESLEGPVTPPAEWPSKGSIEFKNVKLVYKGSDKPALRSLNLSIKGGEKIGICGRTGAGKSSVLTVLFRLEHISEGTIMIDNVDTSQVPCRELRGRLSIIPQDPFLYTGTVRENLDQSCGEDGDGGSDVISQGKTDEQLWTALRRAHMDEAVEKLGGLEAQVGEKGQYFSAGQKQLMCLARALLANTPILCLDEATANVDAHTDEMIQSTIREEFKGRTVVTIAHRINTILYCDRVVVLNQGQVAECGPPRELMARPETMFAQLVKAQQSQSQGQASQGSPAGHGGHDQPQGL